MIKKIYKYQLKAVSRQTIKLPMLAQILSVDAQYLSDDLHIVLWAMVNPAPDVRRQDVTIRMVMTGEELVDADRLEYIGTIQFRPEGYLVPVVTHFFIEHEQ